MPTPITIAVAGKGGSGKSTLAALLIHRLAQRGESPILGVDADPDGALGWYMNLEPDCTVGELKESLKGSNLPQGKAQMAQMGILQCLAEGEEFDILTMGRGQGTGCYCAVNDLTRRLLGNLAEEYRSVVVDNEAGLEHLSRGLPFKVNLLAVLCRPERMEVMSAKRIIALSDELGLDIANKALVVNQSADDAGVEISTICGLDRYVTIPRLPILEKDGISDRPPDWSKILMQVDESLDRLIDWAIAKN